MLHWVAPGAQGLLSILLVTIVNKHNPILFVPANIMAIALAGNAASELRRKEKEYEDIERREDMLFTLKEVQGEEQLTFLESAAESKLENEKADKEMERQLKMLQETAPLFSDLLSLTGRNGAVERMALGMLQGGSPLGEVLIATADAEIRLEQAKMTAVLQQREMELQSQSQAQATSTTAAVSTHAAIEPSGVAATDIKRAGSVVGIKTECLEVKKAPSYQRLIFSLKTSDFSLLAKWKAAAKLALGERNDLPMYIFGKDQVAVELALPAQERTFYDFPVQQWSVGTRILILGKSLDGEVRIDLASEDTPQVLVVGTTGSGKSNFLRSAAYCLLQQGAKVDICGGKVSDYEDFPARFPSISINDMGRTGEYVSEYYGECDRRNQMTKEELSKQPAWVLIVDEYKGTVPYDEKPRKLYDQQLCEVARRGRGLKIHLIVGLQRGSKRTKDDPQALPPDLRDNLPCRVAFRCTDAVGGRMVLHRRGEAVTSLQGRGDGIVQSGLLDTRFQAYRFEVIP